MNKQTQPSSTNPQGICKLRSDSIRDGELLDLTPVARRRGFLTSVAMTPRLWRRIAGPDFFHPEDERVLKLLAFVCFGTGGRMPLHRRELTQKYDLLVVETTFGNGNFGVNLICHGGDDAEPVLSLSLAEERIGLD